MTDREGPIQRACVQYLRAVLPPENIVHHSPNETRRGGRKGNVNRMINAANGVVAGFPDIIVLPYANIGPLFFEVKAEGSYATKRQKEVHERLRALGYRVAVVRSVEDVREALAEWAVGTREATDNWQAVGDLVKGMVKGQVE